MIQQLHRFIKLLLFATLTFWLISACHSNTSQNLVSQSEKVSASECQIIQHDAGETEICGIPEKVAVLGPHMLDVSLSLGIQPAGYAEWYTAGIGNPVSEIPVLGERVTSNPINLGLRNTPSLEAILGLKPDLILGEDFLDQFYSNLSAIAPTLLFSGQKDDWKQSILKIAQIFDREEQAQAVIESHNQKLATLRTELAPVTTTYPRVLLFAASQLPSSIYVYQGNDFSGILLQELGFEIAVPSDQKFQSSENHISLEVLPQIDADIIISIVSDHRDDDAVEQVKRFWNENPITQSITASQGNRVYFVDYYVWGSNMRGPIAAEILMDEAYELLSPLAKSN